MGSSAQGFGDFTTWTCTPKSMEEVVVEVMKANKIAELFQTMATVSLNMGNLILGVNTLKNRLAVRKKENAYV